MSVMSVMSVMNTTDRYDCLYSICKSRKSTRNFSDQPVAPDIIEKILNVAYTSPYASNKKNWEIIVVNDRELIAKIVEVVQSASEKVKENIREDYKESFSQYARNFIHFRTAPVLLIPTFRISHAISFMMGTDSSSLSQWERDNLVKSISCVCMLVLLAAESLGLGSCFMTGPLIAEKEIGELIKLKNGRQIGAIIPIGPAAQAPIC